jgi:hypothetical protein
MHTFTHGSFRCSTDLSGVIKANANRCAVSELGQAPKLFRTDNLVRYKNILNSTMNKRFCLSDLLDALPNRTRRNLFFCYI